MYHPFLVGLFQRFSNLAGNLNRPFRGHRCPCKLRLQGLAGDVLHHDPGAPVHLRDFVDFADKWVIERRGRAGFAVEALQGTSVVSHAITQELDGDVATELRVFGEENLAHTALAEAVENSVAGCVRHTPLRQVLVVVNRAEHADALSEPSPSLGWNGWTGPSYGPATLGQAEVTDQCAAI